MYDEKFFTAAQVRELFEGYVLDAEKLRQDCQIAVRNERDAKNNAIERLRLLEEYLDKKHPKAFAGWIKAVKAHPKDGSVMVLPKKNRLIREDLGL